ncbi:MAG: hypothetical protein Q4D98_13555 [Planctomycetia bacterium]|nr:hypothetical protein [Planctomycetia bacterium]
MTGSSIVGTSLPTANRKRNPVVPAATTAPGPGCGAAHYGYRRPVRPGATTAPAGCYISGRQALSLLASLRAPTGQFQ